MIGDNEVSYKPVFKTPGKTQKWRNMIVGDNDIDCRPQPETQVRLKKGGS